MKSYVIKIFIIILMSLSFLQVFKYICPPFEMVPDTFVISESKDVVLEIKNKFTTYQCTIYNHTSEPILYGDTCFLQMKRGDKWKTIEIENLASTLEVFRVPSNSFSSYDIDLEYMVGELPLGKYRILKEITVLGQRKYISSDFRVFF